MMVWNLQQRMTAILASLPKLRVIGMRRSEDHHPWGWKRVMDAVGEDPRVLGRIPSGPLFGLSGPTRLFLAIVNAVASTADVKLRRLYTDAIEIDNIRPDLLTQETLEKACASLLYLEINSSKAWLNSRHQAEYISLHSTDSQPAYGEGLLRLLKATPQLREIGLQIFPDRKQSHLIPPTHGVPQSWRQSYPYICLEKIASSVSLQQLTRIKLEKLTSSPPTLLALLSPCSPILTSLKIRDVRLLSSDQDPGPWEPVFAFLSATCTRLAYLLLYNLKNELGGVSFVEDPPRPVQTGGSSSAELLLDDLFFEDDHIRLEAVGRDAVRERIAEVMESHWYHKPMFSYVMDDGLWHTDTSDEEW